MNQFMTAFLVVSGILTPFILIGLIIYALNELHVYLAVRKLFARANLEKEQKKAPYDDIELSQPPNKSMFTIRLIKDGKIVFEGHHDKELKNDQL